MKSTRVEMTGAAKVLGGRLALVVFALVLFTFLWVPVQQVKAGGSQERENRGVASEVHAAKLPQGVEFSFEYSANQKVSKKEVNITGIEIDTSGKLYALPEKFQAVGGGTVNYQVRFKDGQPNEKSLNFEKPFTIRLTYPASAEKEDPKIPIEKLAIIFYDPSLKQWLRADRNQGIQAGLYEVSRLSINGRSVSLTVTQWPAGDPCMAAGG
ncbi:MAG TPA: hypothetical protein VMW69_08730 [Spirochaetia bacterium]|nr:hypothetical protein [Spirochaetia bacterium]